MMIGPWFGLNEVKRESVMAGLVQDGRGEHPR
jgi:hypothetical protein